MKNTKHLSFLVIFAVMSKRNVSIFLLFLATGIILGHSIIPHHHHNHDYLNHDHHINNHQHTEHHHGVHADIGQHRDHGNEDKNNDESDGLNHLFSHFIHHDAGLSLCPSYNYNHSFLKQLLSSDLMQSSFSFIEHFTLQIRPQRPSQHFVYISPHFLSTGLRGPPSC